MDSKMFRSSLAAWPFVALLLSSILCSCSNTHSISTTLRLGRYGVSVTQVKTSTRTFQAISNSVDGIYLVRAFANRHPECFYPIQMCDLSSLADSITPINRPTSKTYPRNLIAALGCNERFYRLIRTAVFHGFTERIYHSRKGHCETTMVQRSGETVFFQTIKPVKGTSLITL